MPFEYCGVENYMQQLNFEHHPLFIILCLVIGVFYAGLQYQKMGPWGSAIKKVLFALRSILVTLICIFLVSPILKQIINETEKSSYVIAIDNSISLTQFRSEEQIQKLLASVEIQANQLVEMGYEVEWRDLNGVTELAKLTFDNESTNLASFLESIQTEYEGRNLGGVLLVSDGIYNQGMSPAFADYGFEINAVGIGDTLAKPDLLINTVLFNRLSYQGNKFPISVQYSQQGFDNQQATLTLSNGPEILTQKTIKLPPEGQLAEEKFFVDAKESGFQRYQISISRKPNEQTYDNNSQAAFVEIVDGQESIALIAKSPHPDIKALRSAIESNANYDFQQFVMSNSKDLERLKSSGKKFDLVIYHQLPDGNNSSNAVINELQELGISSLYIYGSQNDLGQFNNTNDLVTIDAASGEFDQITAAFNSAFESFKLSDELQSSFDQFPPLTVPFGKYVAQADASTLLFQRVGNITTTRPLLSVKVVEDIKRSVFTGQGIWKWKLTDFANNGNNDLFNELITKLVQYLSTKDDKRKFKVYPLKNEYNTRESIVFETQIYNDLYEEIYGNQIQLRLVNQDREAFDYDYVTSPSNTQYTVTGLEEGVYTYKASTTLNGSIEEVGGEIIVKQLQLESQGLVADLALLRKLASGTGGKFVPENTVDQLDTILGRKEAQGIIHSREKLLPFINLEWILVLLLILLSTEWFIRKYHGSY